MRRRIPLALAAALLFTSPAAADSMEADVSSSRLRAARAEVPGLHWLGLFAERHTFRVAGHGAGLDLSGGAYLRLIDNLRLRGGYRLFDYDGAGGDSSWETDHHGALVGFSLSF